MAKLCEDRVVIVSGAGRGIGREYALMLAEHGAKVVVNDLGGARDGSGSDLGPADEVVAEMPHEGIHAGTLYPQDFPAARENAVVVNYHTVSLSHLAPGPTARNTRLRTLQRAHPIPHEPSARLPQIREQPPHHQPPN